jgi:hypothetical protein
MFIFQELKCIRMFKAAAIGKSDKLAVELNLYAAYRGTLEEVIAYEHFSTLLPQTSSNNCHARLCHGRGGPAADYLDSPLGTARGG